MKVHTILVYNDTEFYVEIKCTLKANSFYQLSGNSTTDFALTQGVNIYNGAIGYCLP